MLVVMANTVEARFQEMQAFEHLIADDRVLAHRRGFFLVQWAWLPEYTILDADFPDVVQKGGAAQRDELIGWQPHLVGDLEAQPRHSSRVPIRVGVARVDGARQRFDAGE